MHASGDFPATTSRMSASNAEKGPNFGVTVLGHLCGGLGSAEHSPSTPLFTSNPSASSPTSFSGQIATFISSYLLMDCVEVALKKTSTEHLYPTQDNPTPTTTHKTWKGRRACFECRRYVDCTYVPFFHPIFHCSLPILGFRLDRADPCMPNTDIHSFSSYRKKTKCEFR